MLRPRAARLKNAAVQILPAEKKEKGKNKTGKGKGKGMAMVTPKAGGASREKVGTSLLLNVT